LKEWQDNPTICGEGCDQLITTFLLGTLQLINIVFIVCYLKEYKPRTLSSIQNTQTKSKQYESELSDLSAYTHIIPEELKRKINNRSLTSELLAMDIFDLK
jgi:hypothetical protein